MKQRQDLLKILSLNGITGSTIDAVEVLDGFQPTNLYLKQNNDYYFVNSDTVVPQHVSGFTSDQSLLITGETYITTNSVLNINGINTYGYLSNLIASGYTIQPNNLKILRNFDIFDHIGYGKTGYMYHYDQFYKAYRFGSYSGLSSSALIDNNLYLLDRFKSNEVLLKINLDTKEYKRLGTIPRHTLSYPNNSYFIIDGYLYLMPYGDRRVTEVNLTTDTLNMYGQTGGSVSTWREYVNIGRKIYGAPYTESDIFEFDIDTKVITQYSHTGITGTVKFKAPIYVNDKIYGIPYNNSNIFEFDINTKNIKLYPILSGATASKYGQNILKGDKIYMLPVDSNNILEFDVITKNINYYIFTVLTGTTTKYYTNRTFIEYGDYIYSFPAGCNKLIEFNTNTKQINLYGNFPTTSTVKFLNVTLYNDKLYTLSNAYTACTIVEFDLITKEIKEYGNSFTFVSQYLKNSGTYVKGDVIYGDNSTLNATYTGGTITIFNMNTKEFVDIPMKYSFELNHVYKNKRYAGIYSNSATLLEFRDDVDIV